MRFDSFEIKNFKGIEHAKVDLKPSGANVFTLIGLNESGKTTVLEAISRFRPDEEKTEALYGADLTEPSPSSFVPKHKKSNFTGTISIEAMISFEIGEKEKLVKEVNAASSMKIELESVPDVWRVQRAFVFENSDFKESKNYWWGTIKAKIGKQQNYREYAIVSATASPLYRAIQKRIPRIVYFPTFLFSFPDKIVLNAASLEGKEADVNRLYRKIIHDVGESLPNPINVEKHIVDRILNDESLAEKFFSLLLMTPDKQEQVNATLAEMSAHITNTVFENWGRTFGGDFSGREISVRPGINTNTNDEREVYLEFFLRDGASQYRIAERSLGFRWFFSFLLFTLYRVYAKGRGSTLFLLDEPASNLHSKAQTLLLESFPRIAEGSNGVIYSTHSHYMVNPAWLDQAFIVSNSAVDYSSIDESNKFVRNNPTSITVDRYRSFVGGNPSKMTYFQPVLDKLDFVPSRLDLVRKSILFEGKGDYLIIEYVRSILLESSGEFAVVPTRGATGVYELVGLFIGWGVPFLVCLDDDSAGRNTRKELREKWGLSDKVAFTIGDVDKTMSGKSLNDILSKEDISMISEHFSIKTTPSKSQVHLYFSEMLAKREKVALSKEVIECVRLILGRADYLEANSQ